MKAEDQKLGLYIALIDKSNKFVDDPEIIRYFLDNSTAEDIGVVVKSFFEDEYNRKINKQKKRKGNVIPFKIRSKK